ncbi:MAG: hypothetical protein K1Y36_04420 [Blastocatellia bacterium]|nr:hypothetical protein [Blastocatellia bacterium]
MKHELLAQISLFTTAPTDQPEVVSEGFEQRRRLLWLPLAAAVAFGLPAEAATAPPVPATAELNWEEFLKQCLPVAKELHQDTSGRGQDAYLYWIAALVTRLNLKTLPTAKLGAFPGLTPPVEFGIGYKGVPFFMVEWKLAPGAILPPHCHPNASVCTVCLEGETRIRNFEVTGNAPEFSSTQEFQVRETHHEILTPGRINTLSALRDNIHTFTAGKSGARGVDISTYHGPDVGFSFLDIQSKPLEAEARIFAARWKKQ